MSRRNPPSTDNGVNADTNQQVAGRNEEKRDTNNNRNTTRSTYQDAILRAMVRNGATINVSGVTPGRLSGLAAPQAPPALRNIQDNHTILARALAQQPNLVGRMARTNGGFGGLSSASAQLHLLRAQLGLTMSNNNNNNNNDGPQRPMPPLSGSVNPTIPSVAALPDSGLAAAAAAAPSPQAAASSGSNKRQRGQDRPKAAIKQPRSTTASLKPAPIPGKERQAWEDRFAQLKAYKRKHGNANPPQTRGLPPDDYKLSCWLNGQRQKFRKATLDADRCKKLVKLGCEGFGEEQKGIDAPEEKPPKRKKVSWETRYMELVEYKKKFGHANPPYGKATAEACQHLAQWLSNQRSDYRAGKKISREQVQYLRDLGCRGFEEEHAKQSAS